MIANTLLFPVMIVLMFGYLLGGAMTVPGGGDYRDFLNRKLALCQRAVADSGRLARQP